TASVDTVGVVQSRRSRRSEMLAPACWDQVSPVAARKNSPISAQRPKVPCTDKERARPREDEPQGTNARRNPLRRLFRAIHMAAPPAATTQSQLAASSLYKRPASPR